MSPGGCGQVEPVTQQQLGQVIPSTAPAAPSQATQLLLPVPALQPFEPPAQNTQKPPAQSRLWVMFTAAAGDSQALGIEACSGMVAVSSHPTKPARLNSAGKGRM